MAKRSRILFPIFTVVAIASVLLSSISPLAVAVSANSMPLYDWTYVVPATTPYGTEIRSSAVEVNTNGVVFLAGTFSGSATVNFDPTGGTDNITNSSGIGTYLSRYNANATYGWTVFMNGVSGGQLYTNDAATDSAGNVLVTGYLVGQADFDASAGTDVRDAADGVVWLVKYDDDGNYLWGRNFADGATSAAAFGVAVDSSSDIYVVGSYQGTNVDFDGTAGTDLHTSTPSLSTVFISKYLANGNYAWTRSFGGANYHDSMGITIGSDGAVYVTGSFTGTNIDFDGTGGSDLFTYTNAQEPFVSKYNSDGSYGWTRIAGSNASVNGYRISADGNGRVYMAGYVEYGGSGIDFDPTAGTDTQSLTGGYGMFLSSYNNDGTYNWTRVVGGDVIPTQVSAGSNEVFVSGRYEGTNIDFDGTAGTDLFTSNGNNDAFFVRYNSDGSYGWNLDIGGTSFDRGTAVHVTPAGDLYGTGIIRSASVNFDRTGGSDVQGSSVSYTTFLTKYSQFYQTAVQNLSNDPVTGINVGNSSDITTPSFDNNAASVAVRVIKNAGSLPIADFSVNLTTTRDWTNLITADIDISTGKSFFHVPGGITALDGVTGTYSLYIPRLGTQSMVIICPGATDFTEVDESCVGGYTLTYGDPNLSVVNIGGQDYWYVSGLTSTGGLGAGQINSVFIDLVAQPATSPFTINTPPEVPVSTSQEFYISYIPSASEFASGNIVDIVVPQDWGSLATCASSTTDADGDSTADGSMAVVNSQIIRFTFSASTTIAQTTGVEFCFSATTAPTPGNFSIAISDTNDGDYGAALVYVGNANEVTVTATVPAVLSLRIKESSSTNDTLVCPLGVLNPGSVNSCSYRIAGGTNSTLGMQVFVLSDGALRNVGDTEQIVPTSGGGTITAGTEAYGVVLSSGTGWTIGGSFSNVNDEPVPAIETLLQEASAGVSDSDEGTWTTVTHRATVSAGTPADAYSHIVRYRAWIDT